jgi:hypothetical protein
MERTMNTNLYLKRLQSQLKGVSVDAQTDLVEEIAAHIEEGENDQNLAFTGAKRSEILENELGSPEDLGRKLRQVHRSSRLLDVLLVIVPTILIFPIVPLLANWITGQIPPSLADSNQIGSIQWVSIRIMLVLQAALVMQSYWRGSSGVLIYWQTTFTTTILAVVLSGRYWPWLPAGLGVENSTSLFETFLWLGILVLLFIWFVRMLMEARNESLLLTLAGMILFIPIANYGANVAALYLHVNQQNAQFPVVGYFGLYQIVHFVWPILFFLPNQRDVRWAALATLPMTSLVYSVWSYQGYPYISIVYIGPVVLVVINWIKDIRSRNILAIA